MTNINIKIWKLLSSLILKTQYRYKIAKEKQNKMEKSYNELKENNRKKQKSQNSYKNR